MAKNAETKTPVHPRCYDVSDRIHYDRTHSLPWEYQSFCCMDCGADCNTIEEVDTGHGGPYEMWCYCRVCDVETFHPRVRIAE